MKTLIEHLDFILTVDDADRVIRDAAIVIEDDRILDLGHAGAVNRRHSREGFDLIKDGTFKGMCPGFVDAHVHLSETLSRAVFPDNLDTRAWVFHWAKPFYAHISADDEYWGALLGITEMLRGGTTCFLDMGSQYDPAITLRAMEKPGFAVLPDAMPPTIPRTRRPGAGRKIWSDTISLQTRKRRSMNCSGAWRPVTGHWTAGRVAG